MDLHKLKVIIFAKKKTYVECAEAIGISVTAFNSKMNDRSKFKVTELKALADFLKMSSDELWSVLS